MGPHFPTESERNEKKKRALKLIQVIKTDQTPKYVRPVLFHSLPTKTSLPTKRKFCRSYQHQNKDYKTNHYLSGSNLEKQNVIDLSFPLHPTPRERIVISVSLPLTLKCPFDSQGKDNCVPPLP